MHRHYTNYLMGREPLHRRHPLEQLSSQPSKIESLRGITPAFAGLSPSNGQVAHVLLSRLPLSPPLEKDRSTYMGKARRQRSS